MLFVLNYIYPLYFVIAFGIGVLISYILSPEPRIVIKHPTPENAGKIIYRDDGDVCYKYKRVPLEHDTSGANTTNSTNAIKAE